MKDTLTEEQRIMLALLETEEFRAKAGIENGAAPTFQQLADILDVDIQAVQRIERRALKKMRVALENLPTTRP